MVLLRLGEAVYESIKEELCSLSQRRGYFGQILSYKLIIEKYLSHQTPFVLSFLDYEQIFDSADKRSLTKVLSLYSISDKYNKVISAI